jgi:hypothetical protein
LVPDAGNDRSLPTKQRSNPSTGHVRMTKASERMIVASGKALNWSTNSPTTVGLQAHALL